MRDFNDYEVYVFDLDGTLYDQPLLRKLMAVKLLSYYALHPFRLRDLFLLYKFRKIKDEWDKPCDTFEQDADYLGLDILDATIAKRVAARNRVPAQRVYRVVRKWIYDEPLDALCKAKDDKLAGFIARIRTQNKKVVIWSDYPVSDKLDALDIQADYTYSSADVRIGELKPSPKGLLMVIDDLGVDKEQVIMIGDRMEKDGQAAISAAVDYCILPRKLENRNSFYDKVIYE